MTQTTGTIEAKSRYEVRMEGASQILDATDRDAAIREAKEWMRDGDWDTTSGTIWVHGSLIDLGQDDEYGDVPMPLTVEIDPEEPECIEGQEHNWQSPIAIVGGCKEAPGVYGHGSGVTSTEVCMHCGCEKFSDSWAQDPETGEQGLGSVRYEEGKYADHDLVGLYSYTVRTDADLTTGIEAKTIDDAARIYAEDEFPGASITDVADLFAKIEEIGDGAWCWIEGDGPDGERQSIGHVAGVIGQ